MSALTTPPQYHAVGIALAIGSGALIGSSFVFKKKGLLASQGDKLGEGVAYLKNAVWWTGMIMMIVGELCNFGAYAFVAAIIVTPMGALSVVICAILSSLFLKEKLTLIGWIGCGQCIVGSVIIALNAPEQQSANTIAEFKKLFLAAGFLSYGSVVIASALVIIFFFAPKYGKNNMLWYISVCSLIGGISVSCTQGLGACIVTSIRGENQFKNWFIYFLIAFVVITLVTEIYFLNMALALFNTAMVTPVYFTLFTTCTLVTSLVLYQGVKASARQIITVVLGFLVICSGVSLLQLSKVDPSHLQNLDRRTTILLQATREEVRPAEMEDPEKGLIAATEEPGIDAMRGTFGGLGTLSRARRRHSMISGDDNSSHRRSSMATTIPGRRDTVTSTDGRENVAGRGVRRFQLHDPPIARGNGSISHPPSSFHPDAMPGTKKRDSHDSDMAVRGSVAGEPIAHENSANGGPGLREKMSQESLNKADDMTADGDLSMGTLLAQQQWADRRSSVTTDTASQAPTVTPLSHPGTKHTTIQFVEPSAGHRHRERGTGDVPPISATPPMLSPQSSSPSLAAPESVNNQRQTGTGSSSSVDQGGQRSGGLFSSPLSLSPVRTPDEGTNADPNATRPAYAQRRAAASIVRQILESTEEVAEPPDGHTDPASSASAEQPLAATASNAARARSRSTSPGRSHAHSRPSSPIPLLHSRSRSPTTDGDRPSTPRSGRSAASSGNKSNGAGLHSIPPMDDGH